MSPDLRELLHQSARGPSEPVDPDVIHARGRRRQLGSRAGAAAVAVVALVGAVVSVGQLTSGDTPAPFVDSVRPTPSPSEDTEQEPQTNKLQVSDLDRVVAVAEDAPSPEGEGRIKLLSPDGSESEIRLATSTPSAVTWFPDDRGGIIWQAPDEASSRVLHEASDGQTTVLAEASGEGDVYRLVGVQDGGVRALVERRTGTTPNDTTADLLAVPLDGDDPEVLAAGVGGWESGISQAAAIELLLYGFSVEASQFAIVDRPDGDPVTVFQGGDATGEYVAGVALDEGQDGFVLIESAAGYPDHPDARLLQVDVANGRVTGEIDVPLQQGIGDMWAVPRDVSVAGGHLLINRDAEGEWLRPLILDLATGSWAELDVAGRARLGPPPTPPTPPQHACVTEDADLANAEPAGDRLHVYLPCIDEVEAVVVYRLDTGQLHSGDVEADVRYVIDRLLTAPEPSLRERGYNGFDGFGIKLRGVAFGRDGALVVDFDFPDDGVGHLNTSHAGMVWHTSLLANLFQFDQVATVELHEEGSCEAYASFFEGDGCWRFKTDDAPWEKTP